MPLDDLHHSLASPFPFLTSPVSLESMLRSALSTSPLDCDQSFPWGLPVWPGLASTASHSLHCSLCGLSKVYICPCHPPGQKSSVKHGVAHIRPLLTKLPPYSQVCASVHAALLPGPLTLPACLAHSWKAVLQGEVNSPPSGSSFGGWLSVTSPQSKLFLWPHSTNRILWICFCISASSIRL